MMRQPTSQLRFSGFSYFAFGLICHRNRLFQLVYSSVVLDMDGRWLEAFHSRGTVLYCNAQDQGDKFNTAGARVKARVFGEGSQRSRTGGFVLPSTWRQVQKPHT